MCTGIFIFQFVSFSIHHSFVIERVCWQKFRIELDLVIQGDGHQGTTDDFATTPFHCVLFSAALVELTNSIPVHSSILSFHLFLCLPLHFLFTVPCRIVFAKPEDFEMWPNHLSFRFLTRVRSLSYSPTAWIFLQTSLLVTWSLCEMLHGL